MGAQVRVFIFATQSIPYRGLTITMNQQRLAACLLVSGAYKATAAANDTGSANANLRGSYVPSDNSSVFLGASDVAVPSWCYDTPMPYRCDTPGCCPTGSTGSAGAAPSWCLNTPAAYRQYTPQASTLVMKILHGVTIFQPC